MKLMKLNVLPNGIEKWNSCKRKDLKEGDQFYELNNGVKSCVKIALSDAHAVPNPSNKKQQMWVVKEIPWSGAVDVMRAMEITIEYDDLPEYCWD